jgi:hypothetical protein
MVAAWVCQVALIIYVFAGELWVVVPVLFTLTAPPFWVGRESARRERSEP